jgi:hypothetical protein
MEAEFRGVLHRLETQLRKEELERLLDKADGEGLTSDEKQQLKNLLEQEARQSQPHP